MVPDQEPKVTVLHTQIVKGQLPDRADAERVSWWETNSPAQLASRLGSEIVLLTQAADGSMGNDLYTVGGIFHTGLDAHGPEPGADVSLFSAGAVASDAGQDP